MGRKREEGRWEVDGIMGEKRVGGLEGGRKLGGGWEGRA